MFESRMRMFYCLKLLLPLIYQLQYNFHVKLGKSTHTFVDHSLIFQLVHKTEKVQIWSFLGSVFSSIWNEYGDLL